MTNLQPPTPRNRCSGFRVTGADKQKAIAYYDGVSGEYEARVNDGPISAWLRTRERGAVLSLCAFDDRPGSVIDVGCGSGFYALHAHGRGHRVHAVDASPGMVRKLSRRLPDVRVCDIEHIELDRVYDRVVCAGVLDFVAEPDRALRNLAALVAPGGRLVILCPRVGLGGAYYRVEKWLFQIRVNLYDARWVTETLAREGLVNTGIDYPLPTNMAMRFERAKVG